MALRFLLLISLVCAVSGLSSTSPQAVHLAFAGPGGMTVSWLTTENTSTSTVRYGLSGGNYTRTGTGSSSSYYRSFNHDVVLRGLEFSTRYFYVCGDEEGGWSPEFSFSTAPPDGAVVPFRVAVYGDMGTTDSAATLRSLIDELPSTDWQLHLGDIGYSDDHLQFNFEEVWNEFQNMVQPLSSVQAYMVCPGNHEATCHSIGSFGCLHQLRNFTAYRSRFRMPAEESGSSAGNMWYSFDYSTAHFVAISTETDYPDAPEGPGTLWNAGPFGDQLAWLEDDLRRAEADRKSRPWIIVFGHRPLYSVDTGDVPPKAKEHLRAAIEDLLSEYRVDLYFSGHVHAYERLYPTYRGRAVQKDYHNAEAPVPIVIGNAGNLEGLSKVPSDPVPDWEAFRDFRNYGYGILTVYNGTAISWSARRSADRSVMDEILITKDSGR